MKIEHFEDLECWQLAREFVNFKKGYSIATRTTQVIDGLLRYLRSFRAKQSKNAKRSKRK